MISGTIELSGLLLTVVVAVAWADLPYNYLSLSAKAKQAVQWDQITASVRPANALPDVYPPPDVDPSTMFDPNFLVTSFLWGSDEVPPGRRKSLVAPYAAIAKIVFKTRPDSNFTGLFQSGGIGLLRIGLSAAQEGTSASNFVLTFAAKIYIDGMKTIWDSDARIMGRQTRKKNTLICLALLIFAKNILAGHASLGRKRKFCIWKVWAKDPSPLPVLQEKTVLKEM